MKATLFAFLVFGLLLSHESVEEGLLAVVPGEHREVPVALARRARTTLYAIYVLQAATAAVTFAFGVLVFWVLGYDIPSAILPPAWPTATSATFIVRPIAGAGDKSGGGPTPGRGGEC